ncbi:Daunorubicin/doxorubicin resistance ATP-binding protein DrrA [anaerobic digester metagenome]
MPQIEVSDLAKAFERRQVLDGISFGVEGGEVFGLLGPNGAGKTTTMRLLLGLLRPTGGEARVLGVPLADHPDVRRRVGVLLEQSGMADRLSARENLQFYAALHGVNRETVDDRLGRAGLTDRADDLVGTFSTGMKRRLGLVRATLHDPEALLLDEPTSGLDPAAQAGIRDLISGLARESGAAVLVNSHHLDEVERICQRVAILDRGHLAAIGTVAGLRQGTGPRRYGIVLADGEDPQRARTVLAGFGPVEPGLDPGELVVSIPPGTAPATLLRALVEAGIGVEEARYRARSLEQVYLAAMERGEA